MLFRILWTGLALVTCGWCQSANDANAKVVEALSTQAKIAMETAGKAGEKVSPSDQEKFNHIKSWAQNVIDRQWPQAFQELGWLTEHEEFPAPFPPFQFVLGEHQLVGLGTTKDPQAAMRTFRHAADEGVLPAILVLSKQYQSGGIYPQDLEQAFHWYQMGADRGDKTSQRYLARAYAEALGVKPDPDKARWYSDITSPPKPGKDPNGEVTARIMKGFSAEVQVAVQAFNQGRYDNARVLLLPLAEKGDADAQALLGMIYLQGAGAPKDPAKAAGYLKVAAERENPLAQYLLGACYMAGLGVSKDWALAEKHLLPAAQTGWPISQYSLAKIYQSQNKVDQAKTWLRKAAEQGFPKAQEDLAVLLFAEPQPESKAESLRWATKLANENGVPQAAELVGACLLNAKCSTRNSTEAAHWLERAAMAGIAEAAYGLATLYRKGDGVQKDSTQAIRWLRAAADRGIVPAQNDLGEVFRLREGVPANNEEAAKWYLRAAHKNYWQACSHLVELYEKNAIPPTTAGTASGHAAAFMFFELAERDGMAGSAERRSQLLAALSPAEKQDAEAALAGWEARYPSKPVWAKQGVITGIAAAESAPPPAGNLPRISVDGVVQEAKLVRQTKPVDPPLPPLARQARISGTVHLRAVIDTDGTVLNLELIDGHPLLAPAALEAVKQWVYQPTLVNGSPVQVLTTVTVNFTFGNSAILPTLPCGQLLKTENTGKPVKLTFRNNGAEETTLLWIDTQEQSQPFGALGPRQQRVLQTNEGHVWKVVNRDQACVAYFQAGAQDATAVFGGK